MNDKNKNSTLLHKSNMPVLCANSVTGGGYSLYLDMQAGENNNLSRYLTQIVFVNISWHLLNQSGVPDGWVLSHQVAVKVIRLVTKKDVAQWVRSQIIFFDLNFYFVVCLFNFRCTPSNSTKKHHLDCFI